MPALASSPPRSPGCTPPHPPPKKKKNKRTHKKKTGCSSEMFENSSKRYQKLVLWAWLKVVFPHKRYQFKTTHVIFCHIFRVNSLKGTAIILTFRLRFYYPKRYQSTNDDRFRHFHTGVPPSVSKAPVWMGHPLQSYCRVTPEFSRFAQCFIDAPLYTLVKNDSME